MTLEKDWQRDVIRLAQTLGWRVAHFRTVKTPTGYRTPVQADGAGFPDLCLTRDRIIFAELKNERGQVTPEQRDWLQALDTAGVEAYVWRPDQLDEVVAVLQRRERLAA